MDKRERAEAGTRLGMSEADKRDYKGLARHPLARKWMLKRLLEARERAAAANTRGASERWKSEVDRAAGELRRCGVNVGGER